MFKLKKDRFVTGNLKKPCVERLVNFEGFSEKIIKIVFEGCPQNPNNPNLWVLACFKFCLTCLEFCGITFWGDTVFESLQGRDINNK